MIIAKFSGRHKRDDVLGRARLKSSTYLCEEVERIMETSPRGGKTV